MGCFDVMTPAETAQSTDTRRVARWLLALAAVALAAFWFHAMLGFGGAGLDSLFSRWVYTGVMVLAALACAARMRVALAWGIIGAGLLAHAVGDAIYSSASDLAAVPTPSISDLFWLAFYPCAYIALLMLGRTRVSIRLTATRLDGVIAGTAAASVLACATVPEAISNVAGESFSAAATTLAYPIGDLVLVGAVVSLVACSGWRVDRTMGVLACAILAWVVADVLYLFTVGDLLGNIADALVLTGGVGVALAAELDRRVPSPRPETDSGLLAPVGFGLVALGVLIVGIVVELTPIGLGLAAASLLLVLARMALALAQNRALLSDSRAEALVDPLTGLANRRQLKLDLARIADELQAGAMYAVALFDLNGFKSYNDTFGHAAGDALLAQLGASLRSAVGRRGCAYRMGGDEFCVLARCPAGEGESLAAEWARAFVTRGDAFAIDAAYGVALLPAEAGDATEALALADARMYGNKAMRGRPAAAGQLASVLAAVLAERAPVVATGGRKVSEIACAVADRLGLVEPEREALQYAATLHDLGKMAIPESILEKPGPLSPSEWALIRKHPVIGERILAAAPPLERSARLVRWSHERLDGRGYPDGLRGDDIPLAARIVHAADAFVALTSERPYRPMLTKGRGARRTPSLRRIRLRPSGRRGAVARRGRGRCGGGNLADWLT